MYASKASTRQLGIDEREVAVGTDEIERPGLEADLARGGAPGKLDDRDAATFATRPARRRAQAWHRRRRALATSASAAARSCRRPRHPSARTRAGDHRRARARSDPSARALAR